MKAVTNEHLHWESPVVLSLDDSATEGALSDLEAQGSIRAVYDSLDLAFGELFDIAFPAKKDTKHPEEVAEYRDRITKNSPETYGHWVFYPWSGNLVRFPTKEHLRLLRTARNRNLVTEGEQKELYGASVLIVGMSVGSNVVEALLSQGIGGKLILVDMDTIEPTNLNRIRAKYQDVGLHKVDHLARLISETDPFIEQVHFKGGLEDASLDEILAHHTPDVIVDEMDTLRMKLKIRILARDKGLPVVMVADNSDGIILDVERYDLKKNLPILHGRIPEEVVEAILQKADFSRQELAMVIGQYFIGLENTTPKMLKSLAEVGKTLPSWPQLGSAAALAGIYIAYCTKKIVLQQPLIDGRHLVGPEKDLDPEFGSAERKHQLQTLIRSMQEHS